MTTPDRRLSFGVKTSQMGLSYEQILTTWREADQIPVFEHAWLWDHMVRCEGTSPERPSRRGRCFPPWPPRPAGCGSASS
jgi:hypothetical protein